MGTRRNAWGAPPSRGHSGPCLCRARGDRPSVQRPQAPRPPEACGGAGGGVGEPAPHPFPVAGVPVPRVPPAKCSGRNRCPQIPALPLEAHLTLNPGFSILPVVGRHSRAGASCRDLAGAHLPRPEGTWGPACRRVSPYAPERRIPRTHRWGGHSPELCMLYFFAETPKVPALWCEEMTVAGALELPP